MEHEDEFQLGMLLFELSLSLVLVLLLVSASPLLWLTVMTRASMQSLDLHSPRRECLFSPQREAVSWQLTKAVKTKGIPGPWHSLWRSRHHSIGVRQGCSIHTAQPSTSCVAVLPCREPQALACSHSISPLRDAQRAWHAVMGGCVGLL